LRLHIGLDDTDSPEGGCTTYVAALLAERLLKLGAKFLDCPILLRLNPNTPWKTRGNAAVCLRVEVNEGREDDAIRCTLDLVERYGQFGCDNTNPGAVFHFGEVPEEVESFSEKVVKQIVEREEAMELIRDHGMHAYTWKNGRGIIGALAAVGGTLRGDHTYEIITYRTPENWGSPRRVDAGSVRRMDEATGGGTFNNVDEKGKPLITPHGPDPVLYGVRGESPEAVYQAYGIVEELEPVERWMIYRSNQGTDAHFGSTAPMGSLTPYNPAIIEGMVSSVPETITGSHVIFKVRDGSGEVDCAAYEPTGSFRHVVRRLIPGDEVRVYGGVRPMSPGLTLNAEKLEVLSLAEKVKSMNPRCPECGGGTESMGSGQGYRCKKCGYRDGELGKLRVVEPRELRPGVYLPDRDAHRHLTKPLKRYGRERDYVLGALFEPWIGFPAHRE
jgi:tRNA(Ile2)-agmatinylcytidine synthase